MSRAVAPAGAGARDDARASSAAGTRRSAAAKSTRGYFCCSELPLTSLAFLLPFILLYELGTRWAVVFDPAHPTEQRIIAFNLMQQFFQLFGASGRYLPALAVIGILLAWHLARSDPWKIDVRHLFGMMLESAILALPLIALGFVAARYLPLFLASKSVAKLVILSIGAGIYEELVFRLIGFAALSLLFIDLLRIRRAWAYVLIVLISSLGFSLYHYLGNESFQLRTFTFRTVAGLYFGTIFIFRGFGITAGNHAAYDIIVVSLRAMS
jgi:hypothetical protein